jgi:diguanylate cyclase (GGDEF)-like protein
MGQSVQKKTNSNDESWNLLSSALDVFPVGLVIFGRDLKMIHANRYLKNLLDYADNFFQGPPKSLEDVFRYNALRGEYGPGDPAEIVKERMALVEKRVRHVYERTRPNGTVLEVRGEPLPGGGFATVYVDVTEQRAGQKALEYMATHDTLTGISNRVSLEAQLARLGRNPGQDRFAALLFIDLNGFKNVNDKFGHSAGDELLKVVGARLKRAVREVDFVCRAGGDEFVLILKHAEDKRGIEAVAARLSSSIAEPFVINDQVIRVSASIGIAQYPADTEDPARLMELADAAMYRSKTTQQSVVFTEGLAIAS